jgi:hypothetical protein
LILRFTSGIPGRVSTVCTVLGAIGAHPTITSAY